jgi:hypothetical protein
MAPLRAPAALKLLFAFRPLEPQEIKNLRTASSTAENFTCLADCRTLKTMSQPGPSSAKCFRVDSRNRRLMRFRSTAPPTARGTVSPIRLTDFPLARANATRKSKLLRLPSV